METDRMERTQGRVARVGFLVFGGIAYLGFHAAFLSIYGLNDLAFMLFFAWAFWAQSPQKQSA